MKPMVVYAFKVFLLFVNSRMKNHTRIIAMLVLEGNVMHPCKYSVTVCLLESSFFLESDSRKVNSEKVNYFPIFGGVMKNKLENTFQCLVMSWKMSWKITY